jgi:hypothetical protein
MMAVGVGTLLVSLFYLKVARVIQNGDWNARVESKNKNLKNKDENRTSFGLHTLLLPESHFGLSNQMACLNLAAVLAKQYNRTLLVPPNGVSYNRGHHMFPVPFDRVYDMQLSSERISFHIDQSGAQQNVKKEVYEWRQELPEHCQSIITVQKVRSETLGHDPYPAEEFITLLCKSTHVHLVAPPAIFPHADQVFFPYNVIYRQAAVNVISFIKKQVLARRKNETKSTFRLLALHVRRGDRSTVPLFNCSHLGDFYPYITHNTRRKDSAGYSSMMPGNDSDHWEHVLTWDRVFEHMTDPHCSNKTFPFCAVNFDAIFVATNDPTWVRNMANQTKLPPLSMIGDFPFLKKNLLYETLHLDRPEESAEMLLIEEMIMALSDMYVPSFPSSIPQVVLRLRIDAKENEEKESAKHLLDTYYDFKTRTKTEKTVNPKMRMRPWKMMMMRPSNSMMTRLLSNSEMTMRPLISKTRGRPLNSKITRPVSISKMMSRPLKSKRTM